MNFANRMKKHNIALLVIVLLGLALRLYAFDWGLPTLLHRWPYHPDEAVGLIYLGSMNMSTGEFSAGFIWGSFYLYLLGAVLKLASILGLFMLSSSQDFYVKHISELAKIYMAGRVVSVVWGTLSVYLTYVLGKLVADRRTGLLAGLSAAIMPFAVVHSHFMTPHIQFASLVLLALIAGVRILARGCTVDYVCFAVATGLAIGTYWFFGLTLFVFLLSVHAARSSAMSVSANWLFIFDRRILLSTMVVLVSLFAVAPSVFFHWKEFLLFWQQTSGAAGKPNMHIFFPFWYILPYGSGSGMLMLSLLGIVWSFGRRRPIEICLVLWMAAYYLMVVLTGSQEYVRRFAPLLYVLPVFGMKLAVELWDVFKGRSLPRFGVVVITGSVLLSAFMFTMAELRLMSSDTRDDAFLWINANIPAGKSIGIVNWFHVPHLDIRKYKITEKVMAETLQSRRLDYYMASDFESGLRNIQGQGGGYSLLKSFSRKPSFLGIQFDDARAPEDMRYANPNICIFEYRRWEAERS